MKSDSFSQKIVIPCYNTDTRCQLRASAFMDFAQEAAQLHADILGFGYDDLQRTRTAWVLSRMHIRFVAHPEWRDEVSFRTWHKGAERLFYLRDFQMTGADGRVLVEATSSWLVLNIDTRRLVRNLDLDGLEVRSTDNAIEQPCDKVQMPKEVEVSVVGERVVSYSDVDMNGHTNNARYLVWAMDALDFAMTSLKPVSEVKINFNHETRPGDTVTLHHAVSGDSHYIEGTVGDQSAFCVAIRF